MIKKKFKQIYLEITTCCNLSCPFCPNRTIPKKTMPIDKIEFVIKRIKEYTDCVCLHVQGEPLLHPHFEDIVKLCNENNLMINLTTNGVLIKKLIDVLEKYQNFSKINISLQSIVNFQKNDEYLQEIKEFIEFIRSQNIMIPINLRLWNDKTNIDNDLINRKCTLFFKDLTRNCLITNVRISEDDEFEWPTLEMPINPVMSTCLGGKSQLAILVDGRVVLCCLDYLGKTSLGNIFEQNLNDIVESDDFNKIIKGFNDRKPSLELCQRCTYRNRFVK